jgi:hypothetical protein
MLHPTPPQNSGRKPSRSAMRAPFPEQPHLDSETKQVRSNNKKHQVLVADDHAEILTLNPPIIAPIRFAPKKEDGFNAWRKVVEKISPAKKSVGDGPARSRLQGAPSHGLCKNFVRPWIFALRC